MSSVCGLSTSHRMPKTMPSCLSIDWFGMQESIKKSTCPYFGNCAPIVTFCGPFPPPHPSPPCTGTRRCFEPQGSIQKNPRVPSPNSNSSTKSLPAKTLMAPSPKSAICPKNPDGGCTISPLGSAVPAGMVTRNFFLMLRPTVIFSVG